MLLLLLLLLLCWLLVVLFCLLLLFLVVNACFRRRCCCYCYITFNFRICSFWLLFQYCKLRIMSFQDYQMDCYFRQSWVDSRLQFNSSTLEQLQVSVSVLDKLWKPDTHFLNGKHSYLHNVTTPNKLLRIKRDGRILYSMRYV